ncbi:unnamed protein product [Cuscuta campestris]|uniref:Clp R domain-containing protein n=1 Tax=Cuscuta campestris TaxID=132261 RepID=A0A484NP06_9ASTE|nr:unnamed protein product [Cuscuta campestris]
MTLQLMKLIGTPRDPAPTVPVQNTTLQDQEFEKEIFIDPVGVPDDDLIIDHIDVVPITVADIVVAVSGDDQRNHTLQEKYSRDDVIFYGCTETFGRSGSDVVVLYNSEDVARDCIIFLLLVARNCLLDTGNVLDVTRSFGAPRIKVFDPGGWTMNDIANSSSYMRGASLYKKRRRFPFCFHPEFRPTPNFWPGSKEPNEMAAHCVSIATAATAGIYEFRRRKSVKLAAEVLNFPWNGAPTRIPLQSTSFGPFLPKRSLIKASVSISLPSSNADGAVSVKNLPDRRWSSKAIKSFAMSELEARKLKYATTGTAALLMGILIEGTSFASKYLWAIGITLLKVREETIKVCGKASYYTSCPEHPPLTEDAEKALDWALSNEAKTGGDGEITTTHLLLGIWSQEGSPGHKIMASLGFNNEKAQELKDLISKPGFNED